MLNNSDKIRVENRANAVVVYRIPESNAVRRFVGHEIKEIPMGELRQAIQIPGTKTVIEDDLIIHSKEAVEELLPGAEPEYFYTISDVDFLLEKGTLDQLKDALDFAPEGVITVIQDRAVETNLNDMRKREAILDTTGFDVTKAIELRKLSETTTEATPKMRRTVPVTDSTAESTPETATRRTAAPKYTVIK